MLRRVPVADCKNSLPLGHSSREKMGVLVCSWSCLTVACFDQRSRSTGDGETWQAPAYRSLPSYYPHRPPPPCQGTHLWAETTWPSDPWCAPSLQLATTIHTWGPLMQTPEWAHLQNHLAIPMPSTHSQPNSWAEQRSPWDTYQLIDPWETYRGIWCSVKTWLTLSSVPFWKCSTLFSYTRI